MAKTKATRLSAPSVPVDVEPTEFQTKLEQEHLYVERSGAPSALMINPNCSVLTLACAASARLQAINEDIDAWLCSDGTSATIHEVLRPISHLAEEVEMLVETIGKRAAQEAAA